MKKVFFIGLTLLALSCNKKEAAKPAGNGDTPCGDHKGEQLYRDDQGGCYLLNGSGDKVYVEKHECNC